MIMQDVFTAAQIRELRLLRREREELIRRSPDAACLASTDERIAELEKLLEKGE